jgi:hypothetical protein
VRNARGCVGRSPHTKQEGKAGSGAARGGGTSASATRSGTAFNVPRPSSWTVEVTSRLPSCHVSTSYRPAVAVSRMRPMNGDPSLVGPSRRDVRAVRSEERRVGKEC